MYWSVTWYFLNENDLGMHVEQVERLFSYSPDFCQTANRKVLGHMNDFKRNVQMKTLSDNVPFQDIDWDEVTDFVNATLVGTRCYQSPQSIAKILFASSRVH